MKALLLLAIAVSAVAPLAAQQDIPLQRPEEKAALDRQSDEFNAALVPVLATAAKSTVRVWSGNQRLAYGTVVGDGLTVLTKFSEAVRARRGLLVEAGDGSTRPASLTGVYQDADMAVLTIEGTPLPAAQWHREPLPLGAFLIAPQPSGQSAAFGVVGVLERNLRETDKAYLGVLSDTSFQGQGVKVSQVMEDSGAAAAGLKRGDIITRINDRELSGLLELQTVLKDVAPTATIRVDITRNGKPMTLEAVLGNRPKLPSFPNSRLRAMEQMGTDLSRVRSDFPNAIQSDMRPNPNQVGGPVVDLQGRIVGISLARADRTRSFIMPAEAVARMLEAKPTDPAVAQVATEPAPGRRAQGRRGQQPPPGIQPADPDRARRHIDDMNQLMKRLREELERLEQP